MTEPDSLPENLSRRFARDMAGIYERAKREAGYNATFFLRMLADLGAKETARKLVLSPTLSAGFTTLWEKGRLDLSVEALVVREDYEELFEVSLIETARSRLAQHGWDALHDR